METTSKGRVSLGILITFIISLLAFQPPSKAGAPVNMELLAQSEEVPVFTEEYEMRYSHLVDGKYELRSNSKIVQYFDDLNDYLSISDYTELHQDGNIENKLFTLSFRDENGNFVDYQSQKKGEKVEPEPTNPSLIEDYYKDIFVCIETHEFSGGIANVFTDIPKNDPKKYQVWGGMSVTNSPDEDLTEEDSEDQQYSDHLNKLYDDYYADMDKFYLIQGYSRALNTETLEPMKPAQKLVLKFKIYGLIENLKNSENIIYELREENGQKYHVFSMYELNTYEISEPSEKDPYFEAYFNTEDYHQEKTVYYSEFGKDEYFYKKVKEVPESREEIFNPEKYQFDGYEIVKIEIYENKAPIDYYSAEDGCYDYDKKLSEAETKKVLQSLPKSYKEEKKEYLDGLVETYSY